MSIISPNYTDTGQSVVSMQTLTLGSVVSGVLDLSAKRGAWIFPRVGRGGTTALTTGIGFFARRKMNAGAISQPTTPTFIGDTTAASSRPTCAATGNSAGSANLVTVSTGFAANDLVFIDDTGNVGLSSSEWIRVSKVTSTVTHQVDQNGGLQNAHNSVSAHATNHADIYPAIWLDGGCKWEIGFDYGASTTGDTNVVECRYSTYDNDSVA